MAYARDPNAQPDVIIDYAPEPTGGWQYKPQYSTPPVVIAETQPQPSPQPRQTSTWLYVAIGAAVLYFLTKK